METTKLVYGEELVLRCKNNGGGNVKRRVMELTKPIVVNVDCSSPEEQSNVDCSSPEEISTPQTFQEAMLAGDLYAVPTAGHMWSGVQTKYLPVTHLPDGNPNPARLRLLRQRSLERDQALANMSELQMSAYKGKIAKLSNDPRLVHARKKGLFDVYNTAVKSKQTQRNAKKSHRLVRKTLTSFNPAGKGGRRKKSQKRKRKKRKKTKKKR